MRRLCLAVLLLCALGAWLPRGGGSLTGCVPGTPTPDGTLYTAPSSCTITTSVGTVFSFSSLFYNNQPGWTIIKRNGANDTSWLGGSTNSGDQIAIADSSTFMKRSRPYTQGPTDCIPNAPAEIWWLNGFEANAPMSWLQTAGPTVPITPQSFAVAGGASYYSFAAAAAAVGVNGTISIPAPPGGQPYWQAGAIITQSGVTIQGTAATQFGCLAVGSGSNIELKATGITIKGLDSGHPLNIWGGQNATIGARVFSNATGYTLQDVDIAWNMDGVETKGGSGTLTRVALHDSGYNQAQNGQDHNAYIGWDSFATTQDIDTLTVNGGSTYDVSNSGHLFKSRISGGTFANWSMYCDTNDGIRCDPSSLFDMPCGGNYSLSGVTLERAFSESTAFFTFGDELSSISANGCPMNVMFTGNLTPNSNVITSPSINPITLGIGIGDDISNCAGANACDAQFTVHSTVTGVSSTTITVSNNAHASLPNPTGTWFTSVGPLHFSGNAALNSNQITGITENPAPAVGTLRVQYPTPTTQSTWDGIWPGYRAYGPGVAADATVASTGGSTGNYSVTLTCGSPPCITSASTGAAFNVTRNHTLSLNTCWIINDYTGSNATIVSSFSNPAYPIHPVTVSNCKIVGNATNSTMPFGNAAPVTIGAGNLCYANRAAAGLAPFPFMPTPPTSPPVANGHEITCPTS